MIEKPILFSSPMIRAILEGRKTQTRRVVIQNNGKPPRGDFVNLLNSLGYPASDGFTWAGFGNPADPVYTKCPYGGGGGRLWVRETWATLARDDKWSPRDLGPGGVKLWYAADGDDQYNERGRWRPSIHMPRWASRITLGVTGVRVERVQEISVADAYREGLSVDECQPGRGGFERLWDSINGKRPGCSWADNPWVWRIEFKIVQEAKP